MVVGGSLSDRGRTELCALLKKNLDIFAWKPSDMTGVPRSVAKHKLNIREGCPPVRQKKRGQAPERAKAIQAEVQKLVEARIMREVYYHDWMSNLVMVKKHDESWRMCVDFTDLNKACLQDCYPLPEIDWKVESLCGFPFKWFLDAYKGYHQIQLAEADEEKTAFHTGQGVYCYTKMPFGFKNAGATYQRLMDKAFKRQMGQNIEVYVDDLVVKSHTEVEMVRDIEETPRTSVKGQILADFLNEMSGNVSQGVPVAMTQEELWTLFTDGSSCVDGSGAGLILTNSEGVEITYALRFQFAASNNEVEYEALVAGLRIATQMGMKNVQVKVDSKLVANQVLGTYVAKEDNMIKYLEIVKGLVSGFTTFSISQVPRSKNKKADALSKIASTSFPHLSKRVLVEVLETKSITGKEVTAVIEEEGPPWMTELVDYLKKGSLLGDKNEARKLRLKARPLQAEYVMREIHEGSCSMHAGPRGREGQILDSRHGLLHKVDRSKGGGNDYRRFADNPFKDWCDKLNITQRFALVKHPQSNGLVERANRSLGEGIKARLGKGNKNWVEELPYVLWAHRTIIKSSHSDTPLSLTYGTEAVIHEEIEMPTYRTAVVDVVNNDEELRLNLDLLEERQELTAEISFTAAATLVMR
nr:reverse transcriptase domain-containing protein [Tanacetum cinerariifolium]